MSAFISSHGGVVATALVALACYNVVMSAIAQICAKLSIAEPSILQKAAAIGLQVANWLSANTQTPSGPSSTPPASS